MINIYYKFLHKHNHNISLEKVINSTCKKIIIY